MTEKQLQNNFISWLNRKGILYYKTQGGMTWTKQGLPLRFKSGFSDLLLFIDGQTWFIELKTQKGYLKDSQINKANELRKSGFNNLYILRPNTFEQIKKETRSNKNIDYIKNILIAELEKNEYIQR